MRLFLVECWVFQDLPVIGILCLCSLRPQRSQTQKDEFHCLHPLPVSIPSACLRTWNQKKRKEGACSANSVHPLVRQILRDISDEYGVELVFSSGGGTRAFHFLDESRPKQGRCRHSTGIGSRDCRGARESLAKVYDGGIEVEVWRDQRRILVAARGRQAWRKTWRRAIAKGLLIHVHPRLPRLLCTTTPSNLVYRNICALCT